MPAGQMNRAGRSSRRVSADGLAREGHGRTSMKRSSVPDLDAQTVAVIERLTKANVDTTSFALTASGI